MPTLGEALADFGIAITAERRLPTGRTQITFTAGGHRGSVLVKADATARDVFEALYTRHTEHVALDHGLEREIGAQIAAECLRTAREAE